MSLIKKDLKQIVSNKTLIIFCISLIFILSIGICIGIEKKSDSKKNGIVTLGVVNDDKDNSFSNFIISYFTEDKNFNEMVDFVFADSENEIKKQLTSGKVQAYLVIPKGFVDDIAHITASKVKVRISEKNKTVAVLLEKVLKSYESYVTAVQSTSYGLDKALCESGISEKKADSANMKVTFELIQKVMDKSKFFDYEEIKEYRAVSIVKYYMYAIMIIFIMYMSIHAGIEIMKEKGYGVLDRYKATTNSCFRFILSKLACSVLFSYAICLVIYLFECFVKNESISISICLIILLITLFFASFSICLAFFITKLHTYVLSLNMISVLTCILGGLIIPSLYLPDNLVSVSKYLPAYKYINALTMIDNGRQVSDFYKIILGTVLFIFVFIASASIKYQRGDYSE